MIQKIGVQLQRSLIGNLQMVYVVQEMNCIEFPAFVVI